MDTLRVPTVETALRLMLDELESQLAEADAAYADAQWRRHFGQVGGSELSDLEAARATLLRNERLRAALRQWENRPHDPLLSRRVTLLLRRLRWAEIESHPQVYQLRNRIDTAIIKFRPRINGTSISRVERSEILRRHPERERRRKAWLSTSSLSGQIEEDVRQLMRFRQALARERGYDNFPAWALDTIGLDRDWVEAFFDEICRMTDAPYRIWLADAAQRLSLRDGLRPWDLAFVAMRAMPLPQTEFPHDGALEAAHSIADGMGLGMAAAGVRVDAAEIPHAALCYAVQPPDDVRILINPQDGHAHYDRLFHEFGHALHWRCLRPTSPVLTWESSPFNEAMACLWARLVSEPEWLLERGIVARDMVADYRRAWSERTTYRLRLRMAQATFEFRAYDALEGDLSALFSDVFTAFLGVPCYPMPGWADSPFWTSHPVYMQNYIVGEAVASQTLNALKRKFGGLMSEKVGAWLAEHYYQPGASLPWSHKVLRATGSVVGTSDLAVELGNNNGHWTG